MEKRAGILNKIEGDYSYYYKNLKSGEVLDYQSDEIFPAASIIKIPILMEVLRQAEEGKINLDKRIVINEDDRVGSAGVLAYMDPGIKPSLRDLCTLMIIHSDNTATNILIDLVGMDSVNNLLVSLGFSKTRLARKMLDGEALKEGRDNYFTTRELGEILESIYKLDLISENISKEIEDIMLKQKIKHKIPSLLPKDIRIASKTGDNKGVTNDVAIIYGEHPFILCFASRDTQVGRTNISMGELGLYFYKNTKGD